MRLRSFRPCALAASLAFASLMTIPSLSADTTVNLTAHTNDNNVNINGSGQWYGDSQVRIGRRNNDGTNYDYVIPFQLPDLQGDIIKNAELTVSIPSGSYGAAGLGNLDLYGSSLYSSSSSVANSAYYAGASNPINPDMVLLQDDFVVTADHVNGGYGAVTSVDVSSHLMSLYSAGAQAGDYTFLIVSMDVIPGANYRYLVADSANGSNKPTLELTIGPAITIPDGLFFDPVNGSLTGDGSYGDPWPGLQAALAGGKSIPSGESAWLMSGYHGDVQLSGHKTSKTTVAALEGHTPQLKRLYLTNASNWTFDGLEISPEFTGNVDKPNLVHVHSSSHTITVTNCLLYSAADASGWSAQDWLDYASKGFQIDGPNCHIENNTILNTSFSIVVRGMAPNTYVGYNTIDGFSGDGMRGLADNCVFEYNLVQNAKKVNSNHDDGFQSWTGDGSNNDGVVSDIVLRGNVFISYTDPNDPLKSANQGIGCFDGFFEDWLVENNIVVTDTYHGLSLYGAINCTIINNTVVENPIAAFSPSPWLGIFAHKNGTPSSGNLVRNNLVRSINSATNQAGVATVDNNITTSNYASHFVDWNNFDLHLLSTSTAVDAGSSVNAPALDYEGDARDSNPDIGADEY